MTRDDDGSASCRWWIRNSGRDEKRAVFVDSDGNVDTSGKDMDTSDLYVRPALWVDLDS